MERCISPCQFFCNHLNYFSGCNIIQQIKKGASKHNVQFKPRNGSHNNSQKINSVNYLKIDNTDHRTYCDIQNITMTGDEKESLLAGLMLYYTFLPS